MQVLFTELELLLIKVKQICNTEYVSIQFNYDTGHNIVDYKEETVLRIGNKDCQFNNWQEFLILREYINGYYDAIQNKSSLS